MKIPRKRLIIIWTGITVLVVVLGGSIIGFMGAVARPPWVESEIFVPTVSTRDHFRNGVLISGHNSYDYQTVGNIPGLAPGTEAPDDLLILVHGFNNTPENAAMVFALAYESLESCEFEGEMIGFSWDANTQLDPWSMTGFHQGRVTACANGPKVARFISDYKSRFPETRIHLMGYSIGTRTVVETILALDEDPVWEDAEFKIDTVHMAGAAVDNEDVQTNSIYGRAIENRTVVFYNYFSIHDKVLGLFYPIKEGDRALGETGIENPEMAPSNYVSWDIQSELKIVDVQGRVSDENLGDNHMGCLGNRDADGNHVDDGLMNVVVENIRNSGVGD